MSSPNPGRPVFDDLLVADDGSQLKRYERPRELERTAEGTAPFAVADVIPFAGLTDRLVASELTPGARAMLVGLLRLGRPAIFPGGGVGIEYGSLLKTAARPDHVGHHVREAAEHLRTERVDVLVVPGMSGYPIGSMYSVVSGIPAVLLKKQNLLPGADTTRYPAGSFVIPSYTGDGDVVMSADLAAVQDIVDSVLAPQLAAQAEAGSVRLSLRLAGADDIIDKATMSRAVSESALIVGQGAVERFVARHRSRTADERPFIENVEIVAWVTPLIKGYNRPHEHLRRWFGISPFAGVNITSVHLDPPALGVEGIGVVGFAPDEWE